MLMFAGQTLPPFHATEPGRLLQSERARLPALDRRRVVLHLALLLLVLVGLALTAPPAQAVEFRSGDTVTVPAGTTIDDDLFAMGQSVTIAGQVNGEVYALGQTVTVTGAVQRDLIAAGQQLTLDGTVGGDLRAAGQ